MSTLTLLTKTAVSFYTYNIIVKYILIGKKFCHMNTMPPLFTHSYIDDDLIMIRDIMGDIIYLVLGPSESVLIDTGLGIGSLRTYVETLTNTPVTVLLTHGHMDHAMGAPEFDRVFLNPLDQSQYDDHREPVYRNKVNRLFIGPKYNDFKNFIIPSQPLHYEPLLPGMTFHVGKNTLHTFNAAGHTVGSLAILLEEKKMLIIGDACTNNTLLLNEHSTNIRTYLDNMINLKKEVDGHYDCMYFSHGHGKKPVGYLESMITLCNEVLAGDSEKIPYNWIGYDLLVARSRDGRMRRLDGGLANLAYRAGMEL